MGEYLQEAVLPVQYDNYVFDLYGTGGYPHRGRFSKTVGETGIVFWILRGHL